MPRLAASAEACPNVAVLMIKSPPVVNGSKRGKVAQASRLCGQRASCPLHQRWDACATSPPLSLRVQRKSLPVQNNLLTTQITTLYTSHRAILNAFFIRQFQD